MNKLLTSLIAFEPAIKTFNPEILTLFIAIVNAGYSCTLHYKNYH